MEIARLLFVPRVDSTNVSPLQFSFFSIRNEHDGAHTIANLTTNTFDTFDSVSGHLSDLGERFKRCFLRHYLQMLSNDVYVTAHRKGHQWYAIRFCHSDVVPEYCIVRVYYKDYYTVSAGRLGTREEWIHAHPLVCCHITAAIDALTRATPTKPTMPLSEFVARVLGTEALMGLRMFMR